MRKWVAVFIACFLLAIGIPIGYATWYVASYAQHACQALDVLTAAPLPPHATAAQKRFYAGLKFWADEDGC